MRTSFVVLAGFALAAVVFAVAAPAQVVTPDPCPRPGWVTAPGPGSEADRNGNGVVCVDPETGSIRDDVDPPNEDRKDANGNFIVCYSPDKGVVTDDHLQPSQDPNEPPTAECPPGFIPIPLFAVP
jgi:hypothetical protein